MQLTFQTYSLAAVMCLCGMWCRNRSWRVKSRWTIPVGLSPCCFVTSPRWSGRLLLHRPPLDISFSSWCPWSSPTLTLMACCSITHRMTTPSWSWEGILEVQHTCWISGKQRHSQVLHMNLTLKLPSRRVHLLPLTLNCKLLLGGQSRFVKFNLTFLINQGWTSPEQVERSSLWPWGSSTPCLKLFRGCLPGPLCRSCLEALSTVSHTFLLLQPAITLLPSPQNLMSFLKTI